MLVDSMLENFGQIGRMLDIGYSTGNRQKSIFSPHSVVRN
jgi:hypothetical protein